MVRRVCVCAAFLCAVSWAAEVQPVKKMTQDGFTLEVFSEGACVTPGGPGMKMFSNRTVKLDRCPAEFKGFLGVQTALNKVESVLEFSVSRPARLFAPLYGLTSFGESKGRWKGEAPEGWRLWAFERPFWGNDKADIYYRDFPAGRHRLELETWLAVPAVIPLDRLPDAMKMMCWLERPKGKEYFLPSEDASLRLLFDNQTAAARPVNVTWEDLPTAGRGVTGGKASFDAKPGVTETSLALGKLVKPGLYRVAVTVTSSGQTWRLWAPVGVFDKPSKRIQWDEGTYPIGPYLKPHLVNGKFGMYTEPYFRATCDDLSRRGFTMVKDAATLKELDIAAEYGMKAIAFFKDSYSLEMLKHSALIAAMVMDEVTLDNAAAARVCYDAIAKLRPDIPVVTCEVGESTGDFTKSDPLRVWPVLDPKLRMLRYYPFRKA
ncbi:MAG TPA: hypothetical protein P5137_14145, partial [Candidatus Brocadiia bacterium]|nr:hypothetical protein [Candidatus Brocadiia bacterium]